MRCPGLIGAIAHRAGELESLSGFITAFLIVLVVTTLWADIDRAIHPRPTAVEQSQEVESTYDKFGIEHRGPERDHR